MAHGERFQFRNPISGWGNCSLGKKKQPPVLISSHRAVTTVTGVYSQQAAQNRGATSVLHLAVLRPASAAQPIKPWGPLLSPQFREVFIPAHPPPGSAVAIYTCWWGREDRRSWMPGERAQVPTWVPSACGPRFPAQTRERQHHLLGRGRYGKVWQGGKGARDGIGGHRQGCSLRGVRSSSSSGQG